MFCFHSNRGGMRVLTPKVSCVVRKNIVVCLAHRSLWLDMKSSTKNKERFPAEHEGGFSQPPKGIGTRKWTLFPFLIYNISVSFHSTQSIIPKFLHLLCSKRADWNQNFLVLIPYSQPGVVVYSWTNQPWAGVRAMQQKKAFGTPTLGRMGCPQQ